jgi:antitoxin HicB
MATARMTLDDYLALEYPFQVIADPDGGYVVLFPDLPGCMTQAETLAEIPEMADDARRAWISVAYDDGDDIPLPSYPEERSGKFVVRLPKSLHRRVAEAAERQNVSLNQYVVDLLARGGAQDDAARRIEAAEARLVERMDRMDQSILDRFGHVTEQVEGLRFPVSQPPFPRDRAVREIKPRRRATSKGAYEAIGA